MAEPKITDIKLRQNSPEQTLIVLSPQSLPFDNEPIEHSPNLINSDKIYHLHTSSASAHINDIIDEENTQNFSNIYCKTLSSAIQHIKKYSQGINTQWAIYLQYNNNNKTSFIFNQQISNLNLKFVGSNTDKPKLFGTPIFNNCIIQFQNIQFGTSGQYDIYTGLDTVVFNKSTVKLNNTIFNSPSNNKSSVTLKIDKNSYCQCINENTFYAPKTFANIDGAGDAEVETSIGSVIGVDRNSTFVGLSGSTLNLYNTVANTSENTRYGIWSIRGAQVIIYSDAININKGTLSECEFDVGFFAMYAGQIYIKDQTELSGITAITKFDPLPGNLRSDGAYIRLLQEYAKKNEISAFNNLYVGPTRQIKTLNKAFDIIKDSTIKKRWNIYLDAGAESSANVYELSGTDSYNGIDVIINGRDPERTIIQGSFRYYNSSVRFYYLTIGKPNGDLDTGSTNAMIHALENTSIWLNNCICNWGTNASNYYFLRFRMHSTGLIKNCTFNTPSASILSGSAERFYNIKATLMSCVNIQSSTFNGEKTGNAGTLSATVALFAMENSVIYLGDSAYESDDTIKISGYDYGCVATYGSVIDINDSVITGCTVQFRPEISTNHYGLIAE